jgi:hypothetical protein
VIVWTVSAACRLARWCCGKAASIQRLYYSCLPYGEAHLVPIQSVFYRCQTMSASHFSPALAARRVGIDAVLRCSKIFTSATTGLFTALAILPAATAQNSTGYTQLDTDEPSYNDFRATQATNDTDGWKVLADVNSLTRSAGNNDWGWWVARARQIRGNGDRGYCVGNLSIALSGVGAAYQASAAGATTLLTLLPTAGALIGAPAKELWVLYKLMPLAGVLSMILSLGGNIVPMEVNQYERIDSFSYAGMVGSLPEEQPTVPTDESSEKGLTEAQKFGREVHDRAMNYEGSNKSGVISLGIALQLFWLACILSACGFIQMGGILVWWCTVRTLLSGR